MTWRRLIFVALFVISGQTFGADGRVQVVVATNSTGADGTGALFSGTLQRSLNDTKRFATVSEKEGAAFVLTIQTMGLDDINKGLLRGEVMISLYKVLLLMRLDDGSLYYLNSWVGYCGPDRAQELAAETAKNVSSELSAVLDEIQKLPAAKPEKK